MKISLALLTIALAAPATILVGVTAPVAFGATAALGLCSIALGDYGKVCTPCAVAPVTTKRTERHPLAA